MTKHLKQLYNTLEALLKSEEQHIRERTVISYKLHDSNVRSLRNETATWMVNKFQTTPHSLVLAVNYLDRFLSVVKVQPKYMKCVAASCYFIAAKVVNEENPPPKASSVVKISGCKAKPCDLIRMEKIILLKLNFELNAVTPLHFIRTYHALAFHHGYLHTTGVSTSQHLNLVIRQLSYCLQNSDLMIYKSSTLALALVMSELKHVASVDWLGVGMFLQLVSQMSGQELSACYEAVQEFFFANSLDCHVLAQASEKKKTSHYVVSVGNTIDKRQKPYADLVANRMSNDDSSHFVGLVHGNCSENLSEQATDAQVIICSSC